MITTARRGLVPFLLAASAALVSAQEKAAPVFVDGQAQVVTAFKNSKEKPWIHELLWVETTFDSDDDGKPDRMHVEVIRQWQTEHEGLKVPVIYETSPYFAGVGGTDPRYFWNPNHELGAEPPRREPLPDIRYQAKRSHIGGGTRSRLARAWGPRGFAVVHSESPGTGLSQGCASCGGDNEALAPKAVIDWLNGRAKGYTAPVGGDEVTAKWCTGKVGMTGTSYNGTLPIAAATTGVDGLEAIIPVAPNTSYYHYYRSHGLIRHPGGYMGEDIDVLYDFINSGNPERREHCNKKMRAELFHSSQDRLTGDYNDFWAGRDYAAKLDQYKAATLMAHGFNDWNVMPEHSTRIYAALKQKGIPCMAYFHQGGHGGSPPPDLQNRWFTRFLYGVDNGVGEGKEPRAWIVRGGDSPRDPTPYADYPVPGAVPVTLRLGVGGSKQGKLAMKGVDSKATETLIDNVKEKGADLAKAEESLHRLLYVTEELKEPLHISGTPRLSIRLAASRPAANLSVWLVSLPWGRNMRDNIITRGWADPQNSKSMLESEPLVPGQFVDLSFDLQPDDQVIKEGQRIGLMIFSSDWDFTLRPAPGTELAVDLSKTTLEVPIVGGKKAFAKAAKK